MAGSSSFNFSDSNPFFSSNEDEGGEEDRRFLRSRGAYDSCNMEERREQLLTERRKVEERTLQSSFRSISLLDESERVGSATAEELARQREQLKSTEQKLDDINSSLHVSQRHIQGIKSIFGTMKNYFSGSKSESAHSCRPDAEKLRNPREILEFAKNIPVATSPSTNPTISQSGDLAVPTQKAEDILDQNLMVIGKSLSRLKDLGIGLHQELEDQNILVDTIADKTESVNFRVKQQNQQMDKILKK